MGGFRLSSLSSGELASRCVFEDNVNLGDYDTPVAESFMPDLVKNRLETSVVLHAHQTDVELDNAGKYIESKRRGHPRYLGRCVLSVADIRAVNQLDVEPQPGRVSAFHANILGWSNDLSRQLLEAEHLAAASTYVRRAS